MGFSDMSLQPLSAKQFSPLYNTPIQKGSDTTEICYVFILTVLPEAGKHAFGINGKLGAERLSSTPKCTQDFVG